MLRAVRSLASCAFLFGCVVAQDLFLARSVPIELERGNLPSNCGMKFDVASKTVSNQGKFAVWHDKLQAIFYVDSPAFTPAWSGSIVYAHTPSDDTTHEVYRCDFCTIGSVMPRKTGGVVLAVSRPEGDRFVSSIETMDVDPKSFRGATLHKVATLPRETKGKFNNGNCDPSGRLWLGTFDYGKEQENQGKVWVIERRNGSVDFRIGIDRIGHPNGLIWNSGGTELLFSRTYANVVLRYNYSVADGKAFNPQEVVAGNSKNDLFDSICGFEDGSFLVTEPGFWRVKHFNADGSLRCIQSLPGKSNSNFVASCAFGNGDLYIPTGRNGGSDSGPDGWMFRVPHVAGGYVSHPCDI